MPSSFVIAGTNSGCGKTSFALGLMRALHRRGVDVNPFKCGPDYIDTQFHSVAAGKESVNLDLFMATPEHVREIFSRYASRSGANVVEGVMGMFDGYSRHLGSTYHVATALSIPVVLLVNAASTAFSVVATIHGFTTFRPDVNIAGVVFNRVASPNHFRFLLEACAEAGVECFGYIPRRQSMEVPSRHLGLTLSARENMNSFADECADAVEEGVDIDRLLSATSGNIPENVRISTPAGRPQLKMAVAKDEAFNFIYRANLDALRNHPRHEVITEFFSPIRGKALPDNTDILYLPGGYPELFAEELETNVSMRQSIRDFAESGGKIFAECGGMIYLCSDIDSHAMCGVLPLRCSMTGSRLSLGYRTATIGESALRGHEFHYSRLLNPDALPSCAEFSDARGGHPQVRMYRYLNTFAGYTHFYWADADLLKLWNL